MKLLAEIQALEIELHHPGVQCDAQRLEQLLHPDFHEVGRSGRKYDRMTVIRFLIEHGGSPSTTSDDFTVSQLSPDIVLLTYRSAQRKEDGDFDRYTLRSSVWVKEGDIWKLRYHQGTPSDEPW